jgi:hypothetical protein
MYQRSKLTNLYPGLHFSLLHPIPSSCRKSDQAKTQSSSFMLYHPIPCHPHPITSYFPFQSLTSPKKLYLMSPLPRPSPLLSHTQPLPPCHPPSSSSLFMPSIFIYPFFLASIFCFICSIPFLRVTCPEILTFISPKWITFGVDIIQKNNRFFHMECHPLCLMWRKKINIINSNVLQNEILALLRIHVWF